MKNTNKSMINTLKKRLLGQRHSTWLAAMLLVFSGLVVWHGYSNELNSFFHNSGSWIQEAFASNPQGTSASSGQSAAGDAAGALSRGLGTAVAGLATLFIKLISGILFFVLKWMGALMDNTFILEGEIGEKIRAVWVIIRNFVNIFFALALVVVALLSVVGYGDEGGNYAMKKFIPRMALALVAVNFTFLACRLILDVNNVLTTAIFSIPQSVTTLADVGPSGFGGKTIFTKFNCLDNNANINDEIKRAEDLEKAHGAIASLGGVCFAQDPAGQSTEQMTQRGQAIVASQRAGLTPTDTTLQAIVPIDQGLFTKKDFIWVMATQFQGIHNLNKVSLLFERDFSSLTVNALFSVVFAVIYATAYISMFIILVARMAVLWVTIMLSPLVAINIVFPDLTFQDFDIKEKFLSHAFVPAKMAVPLALGYIMLSQMALSVGTDSALSSIFNQEQIDLAKTGEFARGVSFTTLIYGAASVAVLWMGVFAASKGVVGEGLVSAFSEKIKGIGKTAAKWPLYAPIVPVAGAPSLANLGYTVDELRTRLAEKQRLGSQEFADKMLGGFLPRAEITSAIERVVTAAKNNRLDTGSLSTIASGASSRQLGDTLTQLLENLPGEKQRELARYTGNGGVVSALKTSLSRGGAELTRIQTQLKTSLPTASASDGATTGPVSYDDYRVPFSRQQISLNLANMRGESRKALGYAEDASDQNKDYKFEDGPTSFFRAFTGQLRSSERQDILRNNQAFVDNLRTGDQFKGWRDAAKKDANLRNSLKSALDTADTADAKAYNTKILQLIQQVYGGNDQEKQAIKKELEDQGYKFT